MTILDSIKAALGSIWGQVKGSPRELPGVYTVDPAHTDQQQFLTTPIQKGKHYFQVRVNEMYLHYDRQWFANYEPMLFTTTEFLYAGEALAVPTIVGSQLMPKLPTGELPQRMLFANTRVAGLHPYRGGRITLTVILYRSARDNIAEQMLELIQNTAGALDFTSFVETYITVAKVALDGIQDLLGLGKLQPLLGIRREIDPDAKDSLTPGYYVLCNRTDLDESHMWVQGGKLLYGSSLNNAAPLNGDDYVLYSIVATDARSDVDALPFYSLYQQAKKQATVATNVSWAVAKSNLSSAYQMMVASPDITQEQANTLIDSYITEFKGIRDNATRIASLAPLSPSFKKQTATAHKILRMK